MYDEDADPELESNLEVGKEKEEVETKKSRSARTKMRKMSEVRLFQMWKVVETAEEDLRGVRRHYQAGFRSSVLSWIQLNDTRCSEKAFLNIVPNSNVTSLKSLRLRKLLD